MLAVVGDVITVTYTNALYGDGCSASASIVLPTFTQQLYLSTDGTGSPDQDLDRVDPVATSDATLATSEELGGGGAPTSENVADNFASASFTGNDGSVNWTNNWQELGESNGTGSGSVRVTTESGYSSNAIRIGGDEVNISGDGVSREADLTGATSATLTFLYDRRTSENGGSISVEVSDNGGSTWTTLQTYNIGTGTPTSPTLATFDITSFIASNNTMGRPSVFEEIKSADKLRINQATFLTYPPSITFSVKFKFSICLINFCFSLPSPTISNLNSGWLSLNKEKALIRESNPFSGANRPIAPKHLPDEI